MSAGNCIVFGWGWRCKVNYLGRSIPSFSLLIRSASSIFIHTLLVWEIWWTVRVTSHHIVAFIFHAERWRNDRTKMFCSFIGIWIPMSIYSWWSIRNVRFYWRGGYFMIAVPFSVTIRWMILSAFMGCTINWYGTWWTMRCINMLFTYSLRDRWIVVVGCRHCSLSKLSRECRYWYPDTGSTIEITMKFAKPISKGRWDNLQSKRIQNMESIRCSWQQ